MADENSKGPERYQSSGETIRLVLQEQANQETIRATQLGPDHLEAQGCRMTLQTAVTADFATRQSCGQTIHTVKVAQSQPQQPQAQQPTPQPSQPVQKQ